MVDNKTAGLFFIVLQYWLKRKDAQEKTQGRKHFDIVDTMGIGIFDTVDIMH